MMLNYRWPNDQLWGNSLKHIISRLFAYDPKDRLGYSGTSQVMEHPWLSHVDWSCMRNRVYEVRSKPKVLSPPSSRDERSALGIVQRDSS